VEIYERLGVTTEQANCLDDLSRLLHQDEQLDAAEEAASRAISLLPEKGEEFLLCQCHRSLGNVYRSKGEREKAIHHLETSLGIASLFKLRGESCWINYSLARLFLYED
jgi:tetratricopeptide (TPR) repeat protein